MAKKTYSINWENDEVVSFEVNGVIYTSLDEVPDKKDRNKLEAMIEAYEFEEAFEDMDMDTDGDSPQASSKSPENIIVWVFFGVAAVTLLIAGIATFFNMQKLAQEQSARGTVVDVIQQRGYANQEDRVYQDYYYPVVRFTARDGKTREVQMSEGSNIPAYERGDEVTVLYDHDRPLDARIKSFSSNLLMWILPGITGLLGIIFGGAAAAIKKFF